MASGAWDLHPRGASLCVFVQPRPVGIMAGFCVCVMQTHTCMHKQNHCWTDNPRANHFSFSSQRHQSQGGEGIWASPGWQRPFLGIMLLLTPLLQPPGHSRPLYPAKITPQAQLPVRAGPISSKSGGKPPDS